MTHHDSDDIRAVDRVYEVLQPRTTHKGNLSVLCEDDVMNGTTGPIRDLQSDGQILRHNDQAAEAHIEVAGSSIVLLLLGGESICLEFGKC